MIRLFDTGYINKTMEDEIVESVKQIVHSSIYIGGSATCAFEDGFAGYVGSKYCVGVDSGTTAIEIVLRALDLPAQAEVIVPNLTFVATAESVVNSGLRPVFVDIGDDGTMDVLSLRRSINENTSAIICVHLYGHTCDMDAILSEAAGYGIKVIEDSSQAHGSLYKGVPAGSMGDVGCFSFYPSKLLGACGNAGAIVTNSKAVSARCRELRDHGVLDGESVFSRTGRNGRMDEFQAAIISSKLAKVEDWISIRSRLAERYTNELEPVSYVYPVLPSINCERGHYQYVIRCKKRDSLVAALAEKGVESRIYYERLVSDYLRSGRVSSPTPKAKMLANEALSIPFGVHVDDRSFEYVVGSIKQSVKEIFG